MSTRLQEAIRPETIRLHLEDVLNSPQFRNSKRSASLLRFVVEEALAGRAEQLKERVIGAEVFGRDLLYQTSQDPIVRNAALEVRKRLAQYYQESGHANGVRIDLPSGSYVPEFLDEPIAVVLPEIPVAETVVAPPAAPSRRNLLASAGAGLVGLTGWGVWRYRQVHQGFNLFWQPLFRDGQTVQICLGEPPGLFRVHGPKQLEVEAMLARKGERDEEVPVKTSEVELAQSRFLYRRDAMVMAQLAAMLRQKAVPYRLRTDSDAPFSELRGNPLILVGGFDAKRQIRLNTDLRFGFGMEVRDGVRYKFVRDAKNPQKRDWIFRYSDATALGPADYALITRTLVSAAQMPAVAIIGATDFSTLAAGEFMTNQDLVNEALRDAPSGWQDRNLQMVVQTRVIQGVPGPTRVVGLHSW